jgi:hypothetical protein
MTNGPIVVYGAFNSPWSYLASRRAELLERVGLRIDWRAVDADSSRPDRPSDRAREIQRVRQEMDQIAAAILPGERLPYTLAGFITKTSAAVSAYGKAYRLEAGPAIRSLLFEAFWLHAIDLNNERSVHTLVTDVLPSELFADKASMGHDATQTPRLNRQWVMEWRDLGRPALPVLIVGGATSTCGADAVGWLGDQLVNFDVDIEAARTSLLHHGRP